MTDVEKIRIFNNNHQHLEVTTALITGETRDKGPPTQSQIESWQFDVLVLDLKSLRVVLTETGQCVWSLPVLYIGMVIVWRLVSPPVPLYMYCSVH